MSLYKITEGMTATKPYQKVFTVKKFDGDFNHLATYKVVGTNCDCPAWRGRCRHLVMVQAYKAGTWPAKDPNEFYDYDRKLIKRLEE